MYAEVTLDIDGMSVRDAANKLVDILSMREAL
jgi:shikimate kinase